MDSETLQEMIHINFILLYNKGHNIEFEEVRQIFQNQAFIVPYHQVGYILIGLMYYRRIWVG